jgi:DNA-binding IclR family transcriptional regulator
MDNDLSSGVGVLDKAAIVLGALEAGPSTLAQLVTATGLARPTAHRLAVALEHHRLVARDLQGRFVLGARLGELAAAAGEDRLLAAAGPVLGALRDHTNESAQLFRRQGDHRICVSTAERPVGLRDSIPIGAALSMLAGSAAQVLLAWEEPDRLHRGLQGAAFNASALSGVRRRGWAQSVGEREPGVASVSAPVRSPSGRVIAAVSISGPIERLSRQPGRLHAATVIAGANKLTEVLARHAAGAGGRRTAPDRPAYSHHDVGAATRNGTHEVDAVSSCSPDGVRTRATALRGRRARPLHNGASSRCPCGPEEPYLSKCRILRNRPGRSGSTGWGTRTRT